MMNKQKRPGRPPKFSAHERISAILDSAEKVLCEVGYSAMTMDRIAATAQMSKRSLYTHFSDKVEILRALLKRSSAAQVIDDLNLSASDAQPRQKIRDALLRLTEFSIEPKQIGMFRLAIMESANDKEASHLFYEEAMGELVGALTRHLEEMRKRGEIRTEKPCALAQILLGGAFGTTPFRLMLHTDEGMPPLEEIADRVDVLLDLMSAELSFADRPA